MAGNVTVDNGSLTDYAVASDDVAVNGGASAQVQYVKLVDGAAGGTAGIPGDEFEGLAVHRRLFGNTTQATPTVSTTPA